MRLRAFFILTLAIFLPAASAKTRIAAKPGEKFYTQFTLFHIGGEHLTTNYRKGTMVPINTEVTFVKAGSEMIKVKLPDGSTLRIENVDGYSGEKIEGIFARTFATTPADLSKFSEVEQTQIRIGAVEPGMSREAILRSLGYPPKHRTPSLESNQWRYWKDRYDTFIVNFVDGKVASIKN